MYTIVADDSLPGTACGQPGVSLVIPAYNEAACIASVVAQARLWSRPPPEGKRWLSS